MRHSCIISIGEMLEVLKYFKIKLQETDSELYSDIIACVYIIRFDADDKIKSYALNVKYLYFFIYLK
jgi:hypothetical protein